MSVLTNGSIGRKKSLKERFLYQLRRNWVLYLMLLLPIAVVVIFNYVPMYGVLMAFKDFSLRKGILGSDWVGFEHFERFFSSHNFKSILWNTISISLYDMAVCFPLPILLALMLNYVRNNKLKKTVQMISYAPNFISIVVMCGMIIIFLDPSSGIFNTFLKWFGQEPINFLAKAEYYKTIHVLSNAWQSTGWGAIIYISALSGVDQEMHEAAIIDGAHIGHRMRYIDLPSIMPTIVMLFIMNLGNVLSVGFDKPYLLQNALTLSTSEVIATYTYKQGLVNNDYAYSTAVGLFNSVANIMLLLSANFVVKKLTNDEMSIM